MKKYILASLFIVLVFPTFVFAAWWNPFSWFDNWNFNRNENKAELLETKIAELEERLKSSEKIKESDVLTDENILKKEENEESAPLEKKAPTIVKTEIATKEVTEQPQVQESVPPVSNVPPKDLTLSDSYVTFRVYEDDGYGSFVLVVRLTAGDKDIYIPQTTSDSTNGYTGFSYSIEGDEFKGSQDSKIDCSKKSGGQCKISAGETKDIDVIVWLTPDYYESGNYAVKFNSIGYRYGEKGELNYLPVGKTTEKVYVSNK